MNKNKGTIVARVILATVLIIAGGWNIITALNNQNEQKVVKEQTEQMAVDDMKTAYEKLEIGMTYKECVEIVGVEGKLFSESESEYFGKTSVYTWTPDGSFITGIEAHFDNDKLSEKTWVD